MQSWAAEEVKYTNLLNKRLNQTLIKIVEQASGDWVQIKATYNFWNS